MALMALTALPAEAGLVAASGAACAPAGPVAAPHSFMLQGGRGALCALYFPPRAGVAARGDLLVLPSFAEEMNRCRAMVSLQARVLAEAGVGTLVLDPFGTGDSAGEFADATWAGEREETDLVL